MSFETSVVRFLEAIIIPVALIIAAIIISFPIAKALKKNMPDV